MPKRATPHRVAVVQQPPVTLHRQQTLERGVALMEEAAAKGARLISFPETWVPGYPEWLWRLRPGGDYELTGEIHRGLIENSVDLKAGDLKPMQAAARKLKVTVSVGIHERDGEYSRGTLYNTVVLIGPDGGGSTTSVATSWRGRSTSSTASSMRTATRPRPRPRSG